MKKIKLFNLIEQSFLDLKKTNKYIWIIGSIIALLSGGLIIQDRLDSSLYSDFDYIEDAYTDDLTYYTEEYDEANYLDSMFGEFNLGAIMIAGVIIFIIIILIFIAVGLLISVITYYLYHYIYKGIYDNDAKRASLDKVIKVNFIIMLKTVFAGIFFIIPGIIVGLKYAPANYILSKYPELSSKEVLIKSRAVSKGYKWKLFLFNILILIISCVFELLAAPNLLIEGYILLDIISMIITFILTTFMVVYSSIFTVNLFKIVDDLKYQSSSDTMTYN